MIKRVIISILSVLVGAIFILSAISKLPSLEQFGWTIVETTFLNWTMAEWAARLLIGLEFFLGILFIAHLNIRKVAIPLSLSLLTIFSVYLLLVMKQYGADGNCGCFGEWIPMTPLQSILKNGALIAMILLIATDPFQFEIKYSKPISFALLTMMVLIPFIYMPPESIYVYEKEKPSSKPIALSLLYNSTNNNPPTIELRKGKHVIAFMSLTCRFCRKAAKRLRIMKAENPDLPFYMVLNGDPKNLEEFFEDTHAQNIAYSMFNGVEQFTQMNDGFSLPTIKWVEDTTVVRQSNYLTLNENDIIDWLKSSNTKH